MKERWKFAYAKTYCGVKYYFFDLADFPYPLVPLAVPANRFWGRHEHP